MWMVKYDSKTLRVDADVIQIRWIYLRFRKYPATCGRGLKQSLLSAAFSQNVENAKGSYNKDKSNYNSYKLERKKRDPTLKPETKAFLKYFDQDQFSN